MKLRTQKPKLETKNVGLWKRWVWSPASPTTWVFLFMATWSGRSYRY